MEVFVKVIAENLLAGERRIAQHVSLHSLRYKMESLPLFHKYFLKPKKNIGYTQLVPSVQKIEKRTFKKQRNGRSVNTE